MNDLDPYHDRDKWVLLPVRERLARRIQGPESANTRGGIARDLIDAAVEIDRLSGDSSEVQK